MCEVSAAETDGADLCPGLRHPATHKGMEAEACEDGGHRRITRQHRRAQSLAVDAPRELGIQ